MTSSRLTMQSRHISSMPTQHFSPTTNCRERLSDSACTWVQVIPPADIQAWICAASCICCCIASCCGLGVGNAETNAPLCQNASPSSESFLLAGLLQRNRWPRGCERRRPEQMLSSGYCPTRENLMSLVGVRIRQGNSNPKGVND